MRRSTPLMLVLTLLCTTAACATHRARETGEWQPLFRTPTPISALTISADGALFASAAGAVFRALPGDDTSWTALGQLPAPAADIRLVRRLYAPSREVAYAITYGCARIYRWAEGSGWTVVSTPVTDSVVVDGHAQGCLQLYDIWGRGPNDIYAVGSYGTILHFDGQAWRPQRSPFGDFATGAGSLSDVGGAGATTFAVGLYDVLVTDDSGGWRVLFSETRELRGSCALSVAASHGSEILVAGADPSCLLRVDSAGIVRERRELRAFRGETPSGSEETAESTLFWSDDGDIVEVRGRSLSFFRISQLPTLSGVVKRGPIIYVGGATAENVGVVARLKGGSAIVNPHQRR